jgi:hypothetical protein
LLRAHTVKVQCRFDIIVIMDSSPQISLSEIQFRSIKESDLNQLQKLHNEFFPVQYSPKFFSDSVKGIGIGGRSLFTSIAFVDNSGAEDIVGFLFAQFSRYSDTQDADNIFDPTNCSDEVCYILTLGMTKPYRRCGLGTIFLNQCINYAEGNPSCGAVSIYPIRSKDINIINLDISSCYHI